MTRWFVLDINPSPWAVGDVGVKRANGKLRGYIGRNQQLWNYQKAVKERVEEILREKPEYNYLESGAFKLTMIFWRSIDEYKTPQARTHRTHEADLTNLIKGTEDALQGLLFKNDKDTRQQETWLVDQKPGVRGRIIIGIERVEDPHLPEILNELPDEVYAELEHLDDGFATPAPGDDPWLNSEVGF